MFILCIVLSGFCVVSGASADWYVWMYAWLRWCDLDLLAIKFM